MTTIENTLIKTANYTFAQLQSAAEQGFHNAAVDKHWKGLSALVNVGQMEGSGVSTAGVESLQQIESDAAAIVRGLRPAIVAISPPVEQAEKSLNALLNYGGFTVTDGHFAFEYQDGDTQDELSIMRRLAVAFTDLADTIEAEN